jgi:hypothetical protein
MATLRALREGPDQGFRDVLHAGDDGSFDDQRQTVLCVFDPPRVG